MPGLKPTRKIQSPQETEMSKQKYDTRPISPVTSYTIVEICTLLKPQKLHEQTVRSWIKEGLPICYYGKPILINGAALIVFLQNKKVNLKQPRKLKTNEFLCLKCNQPVTPQDNNITTEQQGNVIIAHATCPHCQKTILRNYSISTLDTLYRTFNVNGIPRLCVSEIPSDNTNIMPQNTTSQNNNRISQDFLKTNPLNEYLKYKFRIYLNNHKGFDHKTSVTHMQLLRQYEKYCNFTDLHKPKQKTVCEYINHTTSTHSVSFCEGCTSTLREFFKWLQTQPRYKNASNTAIIAFCNLTNNQRKTARSKAYQESYTLEEIRTAISKMPRTTDKEQRNLAIVSLMALCGLRNSEIRTVKIQNLKQDPVSGRWFIDINPKMMDVKFAKHRIAYFMPFDKEWVENVINWRNKLISMGYKNTDPLFPTTESKYIALNIGVSKLTKTSISNNKTIRNIFKESFTNAGLRYINPHSFRHTIARWAAMHSQAAFTSVSQSLGHSDVYTTAEYYGKIPTSQIGLELNKIEQELNQT